LKSLVGNDPLRREINLSALADQSVDGFMLLVSANKKEMGQIAEIAARVIPEWHIKVLNGEHTTNKKAEYETVKEINEARIAGKRGIIIIANQMGSRSYSVSEIQATVMAYDRGSVDATTQKVSRCLTPGNTFAGEEKEHGIIVDLSFDPNRSENVERLILEEAIQVQRSDDTDDFASAVKFVLSSVDLFKTNQYGIAVEVSEEEMFGIFGDNENMLKVADIAVDLQAAMESGIFDILSNVTAGTKLTQTKKDILGEGVKNYVTIGETDGKKALTDKEKKAVEEIINNAIRALNMSATSVYNLSGMTAESYRECLGNIGVDFVLNSEFEEFYGVSAHDAITLLEQRVLNESILDVIVQNSKPKKVDFLF
jgi:hypothetical protein